MKAPLLALFAILTLALGLAMLPQAERAGANAPGTTAVPILDCADVNGNGAVEAGDITKVVQKFGTTSTGAGYHPLYDVGSPVGSVAAPDIAAVVTDFGKTNANGQCALADTQIAQATVAILNDPEAALLLNCNEAELASRGYLRASSDVPGQGIHYANEAYWDGLFEPEHPEGLVCKGGKLYAQLYVVDGDAVGWGPNPDPEHTNIDPFCTPVPPNDACSWDGPEDTWHYHINLCTVGIGTPSALALPGWATGFTTEAQCESFAASFPGDWNWDEDNGWMGHLWNHYANPNGRYADCFPDGGVWKAFDCPQ
jgi:hypothetical protein